MGRCAQRSYPPMIVNWPLRRRLASRQWTSSVVRGVRNPDPLVDFGSLVVTAPLVNGLTHDLAGGALRWARAPYGSACASGCPGPDLLVFPGCCRRHRSVSGVQGSPSLAKASSAVLRELSGLRICRPIRTRGVPAAWESTQPEIATDPLTGLASSRRFRSAVRPREPTSGGT